MSKQKQTLASQLQPAALPRCLAAWLGLCFWLHCFAATLTTAAYLLLHFSLPPCPAPPQPNSTLLCSVQLSSARLCRGPAHQALYKSACERKQNTQITNTQQRQQQLLLLQPTTRTIGSRRAFYKHKQTERGLGTGIRANRRNEQREWARAA